MDELEKRSRPGSQKAKLAAVQRLVFSQSLLDLGGKLQMLQINKTTVPIP